MKMNFFLDWFEFTFLFKFDEDHDHDSHTLWDCFLEFFPEFESYINEMTLLEYGKFGYTRILTYKDEFMIMYNPDQEHMGVHIVFPGHGMHMLCQVFGLGGMEEFAQAKDLFDKLSSRNCKVTRMDIAYDDYEKLIMPSDFNFWLVHKRIRTQSQTMQYVTSKSDAGGTFYIGRRGSARYMRIYDKNHESKGKINAIRYEFELRREWAQKVMDLVTSGTFFTFKDLVADFIAIVQEYDYENGSSGTISMRKSRAELDEKWFKFLELCGKVVLNDDSPVDLTIPRVKKEYSIRRSIDWVIRQLAPSLFVLHETIGVDRLMEIVDYHGRSRLKKDKVAVMDKYRQEADDLDKMIRDSQMRFDQALYRTREELDSPEFQSKVASL